MSLNFKLIIYFNFSIRVQNWRPKELEKLKQSIKEARFKTNNDANNKLRVKIY